MSRKKWFEVGLLVIAITISVLSSGKVETASTVAAGFIGWGLLTPLIRRKLGV